MIELLISSPLLVRSVSLLLACVAMVGASGCVAGSLATNTGPHPPEQAWSVARAQPVHVGEEVHFDFVLHDGLGRLVSPLGVADYCVAIIGSMRIEAVADANGHFRFAHRVVRAKEGETVMVEVTAYGQRGERDFVQVGGEWLEAESPHSRSDTKMARDSVHLPVYQSRVVFRLPRPSDDLDPQTGVIRLQRGDGSVTPVYINRPGRPGFDLVGPGVDGYYTVTYEPQARELNVTGTTEATLTIYDVGGQRHTRSVEIPTP